MENVIQDKQVKHLKRERGNNGYRYLKKDKTMNGYAHPKFANAILLYGWNAFIPEILETVTDIKTADSREEYYITKFNSYYNGYNSTPFARNPSFFNKISNSNNSTKNNFTSVRSINIYTGETKEFINIKEAMEKLNIKYDSFIYRSASHPEKIVRGRELLLAVYKSRKTKNIKL